jgi:hypothetical protein
MIRPTIKSGFRAGDLLEKAMPYLVGAGLAVWVAFAVAGGVSSAMERTSHAIEAATAAPR